MKTVRNFLFYLVALTVTACATVSPEIDLPPQQLNATAPDGKVTVVFYNDTNALLYPTTGVIGIELNGMGLANIGINKYVKVFVEPGVHDVVLKHWDLITFSDAYTIQIKDDISFVRVFNNPASTSLSVQDSKPTGFDDKYKPKK